MKIRIFLCSPAAAAAALLAAIAWPVASDAASSTWDGDTDGNFNTGANWVSGAAPGNTTGVSNSDVATFNSAAAFSTIAIDTGRTVGSFLFDAGAGAYTFTGADLRFALTGSSVVNLTIGATNSQTFNNNVSTTRTSLGLANNSTTAGVALIFNGTVSGASGATTALTLGGTSNGSIANLSDGAGGVLNLLKNGTGTWTISGANNASGTVAVEAGTLSVASLGSSSAGMTLGKAGVTGTLRYTGSGQSTAHTVTLAGTSGGAVIESAGTGALLLTGNFNATGAGNKTVTLRGTNADANTISGVIADNSATNKTAVAKSDSGKWVLAGANTYTGTTTVGGGVLLVNGSIQSSSVINGGGALGGSGVVNAITLNAGGMLMPGDGIGTLATNNFNLLWNGETSGAFAQMQFQLGLTPGLSDHLDLGSGMFDKGTGTDFKFDFQNTGTAGTTYTLITFGTGNTDFNTADFGYTNLAGGASGFFTLTSDSLEFTVVPEPRTWGMLFAGWAAIVTVRRRRRFGAKL